MKRWTWITAILATLMVIPMLLAAGGCAHEERQDDRAGRDRYSDRHDQNDHERHDAPQYAPHAGDHHE